MGGIRRLEDLDVWQKSRELAKKTYEASKIPAFMRDYGLRDQLRRAVVSIVANIAEGYGRGGRKEFSRFLRIAHGSVTEVRALLYLSRDLGYLTEETFGDLHTRSLEISKMIHGLVSYLKSRDSD